MTTRLSPIAATLISSAAAKLSDGAGHGLPIEQGAQMFWLEGGVASGLRPGGRPRTALTPSLARNGDRWLSFGTPDGDRQDQ